MAFAEDLDRAREPAEAREHGHGDCANCETPLQGVWCHACGQKGHLHNRLTHLIEEFVEGIAHFDGRLWRTLPILALDPGRLSREWRDGKRVRYVAPLHVFLFGVFLFFLVAGMTGGLKTEGEARVSDQPVVTAAAPTAKATAKLDAAPELPGFVAKATEVKSSKYHQYKIKTLLYKLSFLLVPLSMAALWLVTLGRRGFTLYDHATVSLYGLGFLALVATLTSPLRGGLSEVADALMMPAMTAHAVVHLKGAYGLGWVGAVVRGLLLAALTGAAFVIFLLGVVALGVAG